MNTTKRKLSRYFGNAVFYKSLLAVTLPIMVQNGISTFVSLLDNLMVGAINTEAMSGVSVVNQLLFIFNLMVFGATSAAGIFMAQFHGNGDKEGEKQTFRVKLIVCVLSTLLAIGVYWIFSDSLISVFLHGEASEVDPATVLSFGRNYLYVMLVGLLPFAVANAYASSMRETGDTVTPMFAGIAAVITNCVLNYILIFGKLGLPALGVVGAAVATVVSRFVECGILIVKTHRNPQKYAYIRGVFRSFRVSPLLIRSITVRGLPLMGNEFFWSVAVTFTNQCYSTRGMDVVPAQSIYSTVWNVMSVAYLSLGSAIGIVIGNMLGAGELQKARDDDRKMIVFSFICGIITGGLLAAVSGVFPLLYRTTDSVRALATYMILIGGLFTPFSSVSHAAYFTIRSGGKVWITILFDSVFNWVCVVSTCFFLSRFTDISIYTLFAVGQSFEFIKCILSLFFLRRGDWVLNLSAEHQIQ